MKVKVNFKKPTVLLTAEKYSSMLAEMEELKFQVNLLNQRLVESESRRDHNATLYETATRAATELADMLVRANAEADKARAEAEDVKLELMDREFRINELEKQVEWLRENEDNYQNLLAENTELISKNMDLKRAFNETYEKEADFCAEAQFERERADQLEEANKKLYAQVLAQRDAIERLQCQRAADEEDYNTLKGMYDELHMAAQDLVIHIRK